MSSTQDAAHQLLAKYAKELASSNPWSSTHATLLAGGAAHDSWRFDPFPVVFEHANRVYKWDVAGRRYVDLWMGHGALLFGNAHPAITDAVAQQMKKGQHLGGVHALQYMWAECIQKNFPSCESIRFVASGTEATMLALRIARGWTGRKKILRVDGHFHGWHDEALVHALPEVASGFNSGVGEHITLVPPLDIGAIQDELVQHDVAAIILEPGGGSAGSLPWSTAYLVALRKLADAYDTLIIFDEVISGFRYAMGGVQALADVRPDLTVLAKIAAGGMPGGIVGGRADVMSVISGQCSAHKNDVHVPHSGTFNGFPLSAAAAVATMDLMNSDDAVDRAEQMTAKLVAGINANAKAAQVDVRAFHQSSIFHLVIGAINKQVPVTAGVDAIRLSRSHAYMHKLLRAALLLEKVDCHASHGWVSAVHENTDIEEAVDGFSRAFRELSKIETFYCGDLEPALLQPELTCESVCRNATCESRFRAIAGCSLPLSHENTSRVVDK